MGDVTLVEMRDELSNAINRGTISSTLLNRWLHRAVVEFAYALKFPELQKLSSVLLVDGTNVVAVPADFRALAEEGIWIIGPVDRVKRLTPESRGQYLGGAELVESSRRGAVTFFHRYGNVLYLRPVPDATATTIEIHYWAKVVKMVNDGDKSQFDEDWDDIIVTGALYRGYRHFGEFDKYQNVRNDFLGMIRSRATDEDLEPFPEGGISLPGEDDFPVDETTR